MSFSLTIILGRLTKDPEQRAAGSAKVTELSIESESSYKDKAGAWVKKTATDKVSVWGAQGDACFANLRAGSLVAVQAHTESRPWQDKIINNLVADKVHFLDKMVAKGGDEFNQERKPVQRPGGRPVAVTDPIDDSDIPF
jgi:single-stranded DNA-binding protein